MIDEYCALRKNVEVIRNLQEILKVSSGVEWCRVPREYVEEIWNREDKIYLDERRLRGINGLLIKTA